ncbi:MAG: hypothetical protein GXO39_08695 [Thermotogae bacterium]|nr:hypothetical protein [Thermotogota bacterium]
MVLGHSFLCRTLSITEADSLTRASLRHLADHGYPFARAMVWVYEGEYIALIDRGKFYVLERPKLRGTISSPLRNWFFGDLYGKAFRLNYIERKAALLSHYGVKVGVFKRQGDVVFDFGKARGSLGGSLYGGQKGLKGEFFTGGGNLLGLGLRMDFSAAYDEEDMITELSLEVPPIMGPALELAGGYGRSSYGSYYHLLTLGWMWKYPLRFGVGWGYSQLPFSVIAIESFTTLKLRSEFFMWYGTFGYRLKMSWGFLSLFTFRGIGDWKERVGGEGRFRELGGSFHFSDNFAVLRMEFPLLRTATFRSGPFVDLLLERENHPLWAYGLYATFGRSFKFFVTGRRYVGIRGSVELQ